MLDQLVESRSKGNDSKMRGGLFVLSTLALTIILFSAVIWSIFAKDIDVSGNSLQLSSLVAPIPVAENKPEPEPAPKQQQQKSEQPKVQKDRVIKRQTNTLRVEESPTRPPEKVSVTNNTQKARPNAAFVFDKGAETDVQGSSEGVIDRGSGSTGTTGEGLPSAGGTQKPEVAKVIKKTTPKPPPVLPKPKEVVKPKPTIISGGVVNGKAIALPPPPYPAAAKAVGARGDVSVQVTIDENGNVTSASAISGHALLRNAAVAAARNAKFNPTLLSDQPVKVKGVIIYRFAG